MAAVVRFGGRGFSDSLTGPGNTVTEIVMARGQSLSLGPNMGGLNSPSGIPWRDVYDGTSYPTVGSLIGLTRMDGVAVTNVANPLLIGYDPTAAAAAIAPMAVQTSLPEGAIIAAGLVRDGLAEETLFQFHDAGGQSILNLDSDPASGTNGTTLYDNAERWLAEAVRLTREAGKIALVRRIHLNQGEADVSWQRGEWGAAANRTLDQMIAQVMRLTGQTDAPRLLLEQTGGYMMNTSLNRHQCKLDQLALVRLRGGILTTPLYAYKVDNSDGKGVHKSAEAHLEFCETVLWAIAETAAGRDWNILPPVAATRVGDTVEIPMEMPAGEAVVQEAAGKYAAYGGDPANLGLEVVGGGSIVSVELAGQSIRLRVSGTVSAVRYAMQETATDYRTLTDASRQGYTAHRGMLRTDRSKAAQPGGLNLTLKRWLPSFEVSVA